MEAAENSATASCSESEDPGIDLVESFKFATSKLVDRVLRYPKFEDFKEKYYPEIYENDLGFLKDIYDQFRDQIKKSIVLDLDELSNEQKIFLKLKELENLGKEASLHENVSWRPSGDPNEDVRDYRWQYKSAHKKLLESLLETQRSQNEQLKKEVTTGHNEIMMLKEKIMQRDAQNTADMKALEDVDVNMVESFEQMMDDD